MSEVLERKVFYLFKYRCLGIGRVFARTRGDWAAFNVEVDVEGGRLGNEEVNFALESGIEGSAGAESKQILVRLRMRASGTSKEVDSLTIGLQEQDTDKFAVQTAEGDTDGGHERDRVGVSMQRGRGSPLLIWLSG